MLLSGLAAHLVGQWLIKSRVCGFNSHRGQRLISLLLVVSYFVIRVNVLSLLRLAVQHTLQSLSSNPSFVH